VTEVFEPVVRAVPANLRNKLEPQEVFSQIIQHKWLLSAQAGRDVGMAPAVQSYLTDVLAHKPDEQAVLGVHPPAVPGPVTGHIEGQHLGRAAVQDGVIQYLLKPVTSPSLHAAIQTAVARSREVKGLRDSVQALELTLRERKLIERAKGILMTRRNLSEPEAFRFLQRQSQDRRMPMAKLAESIVQADELLETPTAAGKRKKK